MIRVVLVAILVIPPTTFMAWAITPEYAAPWAILFGLYVGYLVYLIPRRTP